jgi:hypothetical protein
VLTRIDRVQMAVPDRAAAAKGWVGLLGAEHEGDDRLAVLAARRSVYRLGDGRVELLEPDGTGAVAEAVGRRGPHLFAAGASSPDLGALLGRLRELGVEALTEAGQIHLDPGASGGSGLRVVVSVDESLPRVGAIDGFYEVTNLVHDAKAAVERCAGLFGLDGSAFVPIDSPHYGYDGSLTLFDPERLDRFEMITPRVPENTMGRFFARFGETLYMAFAESGELPAVEERAREAGAGFTAVPPAADRDTRGPHTIFLHPAALGGMMLGLSRRSYAWRWSGHPERVEGGP